MKNEIIGIIGAMRVEMEALAASLENKKTEVVSDMEFHTGSLHGHDVVLAVCGVGKVFAAMCAQTMILRFGATKIINTGVAGTLSDKLSVCDIAVSDDVVQHDMDTSPLGDPVGLISRMRFVPPLRRRAATGCGAPSPPVTYSWRMRRRRPTSVTILVLSPARWRVLPSVTSAR